MFGYGFHSCTIVSAMYYTPPRLYKSVLKFDFVKEKVNFIVNFNEYFLKVSVELAVWTSAPAPVPVPKLACQISPADYNKYDL